MVGDAPSCALLGGFAIGARDALLWQHYGNAWQSPAVICQAQRTHARTSDKIDAPAACATLSATRPFRFVHIARALQREREMLASTCLYSLYAWFIVVTSGLLFGHIAGSGFFQFHFYFQLKKEHFPAAIFNFDL